MDNSLRKSLRKKLYERKDGTIRVEGESGRLYRIDPAQTMIVIADEGRTVKEMIDSADEAVLYIVGDDYYKNSDSFTPILTFGDLTEESLFNVLKEFSPDIINDFDDVEDYFEKYYNSLIPEFRKRIKNKYGSFDDFIKITAQKQFVSNGYGEGASYIPKLSSNDDMPTLIYTLESWVDIAFLNKNDIISILKAVGEYTESKKTKTKTKKKLCERKRLLNEGPGAGYKITWESFGLKCVNPQYDGKDTIRMEIVPDEDERRDFNVINAEGYDWDTQYGRKYYDIETPLEGGYVEIDLDNALYWIDWKGNKHNNYYEILTPILDDTDCLSYMLKYMDEATFNDFDENSEDYSEECQKIGEYLGEDNLKKLIIDYYITEENYFNAPAGHSYYGGGWSFSSFPDDAEIDDGCYLGDYEWLSAVAVLKMPMFSSLVEEAHDYYESWRSHGARIQSVEFAEDTFENDEIADEMKDEVLWYYSDLELENEGDEKEEDVTAAIIEYIKNQYGVAPIKVKWYEVLSDD